MLNNKELSRLAARVFDTPLMIDGNKLVTLMEVLGPRVGLTEPIPQSVLEAITPLSFQPELDDEEDPAAAGATPVEGIAVINVAGTLVKRSGWLGAMSGMRSYASIGNELNAALNDDSVKGILLDVDSPGGEVNGCFDLCDQIYAASAIKPVYAIANDQAFSAAYAIASSAERVFLTRTGGVGSIGVIALHRDQSEMDKKIGLKYTAITYGARKNDLNSHEPISEEAASTLQTEINRIGDIFVSTVARNRKMKAAMVRSTEAGLFFGENGISAGLADQVGTFDDAFRAISDAARGRAQVSVPASAEAQIQKKVEKNEMTEAKADAKIEQPIPTVPAAATPTALEIEASVRARNEEIITLCQIAGKPEYALTAIMGSMTREQVAQALLKMKSEASAQAPTNGITDAIGSVSAESQLEQMAKDLAASRNITYAKAYVDVLSKNTGLYNKYLADRQAAARQ